MFQESFIEIQLSLNHESSDLDFFETICAKVRMAFRVATY